MKKFYMVIKDGEECSMKGKYSTLKEAQEEAERLCRQEKTNFYTLQSIMYCEPEDIPVKWNWILDKDFRFFPPPPLKKPLNCCATDECKTDCMVNVTT